MPARTTGAKFHRRKSPMHLFDPQGIGFGEGRWVPGLAKELKPGRLRVWLHAKEPVALYPNWEPKARFWHFTYEQWVQFEPRGQRLPFFWSGKAAILPSQKALYAGYYIESGLLDQEANKEQRRRGQVMADNWHWHPFRQLMRENPHALMEIAASLPEDKRCIWVCVTAKETNIRTSERLDLQSPADFAKVLDRIERSRNGDWVDLVVGAEYGRDYCIQRQNDIVRDLVQSGRGGKVTGPLATAFDLYRSVTDLLVR